MKIMNQQQKLEMKFLTDNKKTVFSLFLFALGNNIVSGTLAERASSLVNDAFQMKMVNFK